MTPIIPLVAVGVADAGAAVGATEVEGGASLGCIGSGVGATGALTEGFNGVISTELPFLPEKLSKNVPLAGWLGYFTRHAWMAALRFASGPRRAMTKAIQPPRVPWLLGCRSVRTL